MDATTQASNAGTSATLAQNWASLMSETVDGTSYSAKYYASQAASSASSASASVTSAATSESSAVNAANTAEAYSEQSEAWAGQASASASQASTSASNAASDASAAASSESSAASAASSASSSASAASSSATQAQDSQLAAQVSSNSAGTSATSAANSASAAATSAQSAAEAIYTANTVEPISTTGGTTTLTAAEAAAGIYAVTGTLTSNAVIVVPATSHPFIVNNGTTGAYTLTIEMTGGTSVETVPQGESQQLYCDGSGGIFSVSSVSGFQFSGTKSVTASGTKLDSTYAGVMTSVAPSSGSTIYLPPGATMTAGGSVFLDAGSNFTLALQGSDTADFGSTVSVLTKDKWLFTWNGSEWLTTLYSSSFTARFTYSVTTPLVYASARVLIGTVTDDGATSLQSSGGATFGAPVMVPTQPAGDNTLAAANTAFVHAAIAAIVASSPSTLDTLNELASALGDDANFSTTITNLIATKAALSGASFTGNVSAPLLTATSGAVWASGYGGNANEGVVFLGSGGGTYLYYDGVKYNLPLAELYVNSYQAWHAGNFTPSNYAALAGSADFAGTVTGTGSSYALRAVNLTTGQTSIGLTHEGAATDQKNWEFIFGTDGSIGCRAVNDAYTLSQYAWQVVRSATSYTLAVLELMGQGGRVLVGATSDDGTNILQVDGSVRAANLYINTQAVTDSGIAGFSNSNGPAVAFYGSGTTGVGSLVLRTDGLERARINAAGRMLLGTTTDDGSNLLQVDGGVRSLVGGFTYPDGTIQTTANVSSNPTAIDYTPASGTTTFAVQQYGVGLVQVFANGSRLSNTTGYTATTGNSITLLTAADGNTTYSVLTGVLYEATNLLQPIVQAVAVAVGVKTLTLPASALAGYLWVFQNGAWLVPGVDFTFTGGATATLTTAPTQATDVFTVVILQPVSFTNSATQAQVQTGGMTFVTDTGVANAYAAAYIPAVGAPTHGMRLSFIVKTTNTGASTLAANGGTAYAIYGGGHVALTGGELVVGAYVTVMYNATLGAWVIVENTLGRQQYGSGVNIVGLGGRITADMSNATYSNQLAFQTSTTNGNTTVNAIPNGTGAASQFIAWAAAVQTNSPYLSMGVSTASGFSYINSGALGTGTALPLTFDVNGAERMRIDTSGRVLIGTATSATIGGFGGQHQIVSSVNVTRQFIQGHANGLGYGTVYLNGAEGGGGCQALTFANSSGAAVGTVTVTTSATAYNTTSDYRLKENIAPMTGALKRLMLAKLVRFSFKNDPNKRVVDGFLAHEIAQLVPEAVHGEKDAVWHHLTMREGHDPKDIKQDDVLDVKAEIVAQQVDYSKLVPLLMASVQELTAEVRASHNAMVAMQKQITALKNEVASYRKR
ncbi:tail fiber domain-containing protein [Paraburkholderia sp. BCC1886]|uniref:tail fiber domain-containing protein n=1 Tax=Paraburkholderia sp. BCC1886 TaxID=2562670 RepID=UPI001C905A1F|nr:tail fiber domain-containing protein [Paraburkholderia sp. BCC1886]